MADPFPTTKWTLVLAAGGPANTGSRKALEALCAAYWFPLYAYVRRRGHGGEEAQDLVQSYFVQLIDRRFFDVANREIGPFRAFLLATMKRFLINEHLHEQAAKRGGGKTWVELDSLVAERRYHEALTDHRTPEMEFERRWALTVIDHVLERLQREAERNERLPEFERLKPFLTETARRGAYGGVAAGLGMSEGAVKVAVHRLRKRFGQFLREEIAHTVRDSQDVDAEVRHLLKVLTA